MKQFIWYLEIGLDSPLLALTGQTCVIKLGEYFNKPFKPPIYIFKVQVKGFEP